MILLSIAFAENAIQLVPDGTTLLHILIILVMIATLNATLFKPINRILSEREKRTRGRSQEAQSILQNVDEKLSRYEHSLHQARTESYRLLEQERAMAMRERQSSIDAVRADISPFLEEQKSSIRTQAEEARQSLEEDAHRVAVNISTQILGRPTIDVPTSNIPIQ